MFKYAKENHQKEIEKLEAQQEQEEYEKMKAELQKNHIKGYWDLCDKMKASKNSIILGICYAVLFGGLMVTAKGTIPTLACMLCSFSSMGYAIFNGKVLEKRKEEEIRYEDLKEISMFRQEMIVEENQKTIQKTEMHLEEIERKKKQSQRLFEEGCLNENASSQPYYLADSEEEYQQLKAQQSFCKTALENYLSTLNAYQMEEVQLSPAKVKIKK